MLNETISVESRTTLSKKGHEKLQRKLLFTRAMWAVLNKYIQNIQDQTPDSYSAYVAMHRFHADRGDYVFPGRVLEPFMPKGWNYNDDFYNGRQVAIVAEAAVHAATSSIINAATLFEKQQRLLDPAQKKEVAQRRVSERFEQVWTPERIESLDRGVDALTAGLFTESLSKLGLIRGKYDLPLRSPNLSRSEVERLYQRHEPDFNTSILLNEMRDAIEPVLTIVKARRLAAPVRESSLLSRLLEFSPVAVLSRRLRQEQQQTHRR